MSVAAKLGKLEEELYHLHPDDIMRWLAFFKIQDELEAEAIRQSQQKGSAFK